MLRVVGLAPLLIASLFLAASPVGAVSMIYKLDSGSPSLFEYTLDDGTAVVDQVGAAELALDFDGAPRLDAFAVSAFSADAVFFLDIGAGGVSLQDNLNGTFDLPSLTGTLTIDGVDTVGVELSGGLIDTTGVSPIATFFFNSTNLPGLTDPQIVAIAFTVAETGEVFEGTPVPEPSGAVLGGVALLLISAAGRRARRGGRCL